MLFQVFLTTTHFRQPYWQVVNIYSVGITEANFLVQIDEIGTAYFVVVGEFDALPSPIQVKSGQDSTGTPVAVGFSGSVALTAFVSATFPIGAYNLLPGTNYKACLIAEDVIPNIQGSIDTLSFSTDTSFPVWISTYPKMDVVGATSAGFKVETDIASTAYFVVVPRNASAPTSAQVKAGQDASSTPVATGFSGNVALTANIEKSFFSFNLSLNTDYDVYIVAESSVIQDTPIKLQFKTLVLDGYGIAIHVYGASWNGSTWLSDPTAALAAINDAFNIVNYLDFTGIQILSSLTSAGTGMAFAVTEPTYKKRRYIDPDQIGTLRAEIMSILNTIPSFGYSDVVLGTNAQS